MAWEIGYIICTVLAMLTGVCAMRDQFGRGRGAITGLVVGISAGSFTGALLMAMMVVIAWPTSHIEKVEPVADEQSATS